MTTADAIARLTDVIRFENGRPTWDARDREAVIAVLDELAHYKQYGHNLIEEKKRFEEGTAAFVKLGEAFKEIEARKDAEIAALVEALPRCACGAASEFQVHSYDSSGYFCQTHAGEVLTTDEHAESIRCRWAPIIRHLSAAGEETSG